MDDGRRVSVDLGPVKAIARVLQLEGKRGTSHLTDNPPITGSEICYTNVEGLVVVSRFAFIIAALCWAISYQ